MLLGLHKNLSFNSGKIYPYATGGDYVYLYEDTTTGKTYRVHEFLSTGTSTLNVEVGGRMEYLIVGGGGGGGDRHGGGGGGGGFLSGSFSFSAENYTITVGEGGTGGSYEANNTSPRGSGAPGSNSSISGVATSYGGGGGGTYDGNPSGTFGSGGGGGGNNRPGIAGTVGQGNSGGSGLNPGAGGGGGANSVGGDANNGSGGDGKEWPVGSGKYYAGGGGGAWSTSGGPATPGGTGGGGAGAWDDATIESGSPNTGGGGGGSRSQTVSTVGRPGGSGIVIVRYVVAEKKLWTPSELGSSLVGWWDATEISGLSDDSTVSTWNDISGSGYDVSSFGTGDEVIYKENILNSLPIVRFQSDKVLHRQTSGITASRNASSNMLVAVARMRSTAAARADIIGVVSGVNTNNFLCGMDFHRTANKHCSIIRRAGTDSPTTPSSSANYSAGTWYIRVSTMEYANSGKISQYVDGTQDPSSSSDHGGAGNSEDTDNDSIKIGGFNTASGSDAMDIAETLILKDNVSLTDRQKLEGYLAHKWGLTNNLPSGHPYKYEPPYKVEPEEIVTDGLVLNLDAGDYASYPRSGTTWYDISGNGLTGALTNGPTYDSANKGSIVFDGVNDYVDMGNIFNSVVAGADKKFSVSCFFNPGSTGNKALVSKISDSNLGENQRQFSLLARDIGNGYKITFVYYGTLTASDFRLLESTVGLSLNEWQEVTVTYDGSLDTNDGFDRVKMYLNGEAVGATVTFSSGSLLDIPSGTARFGIGSSVNTGGTGSFYNFDGKIGNARVYNRALSSTEISQNFNALRGRYGI